MKSMLQEGSTVAKAIDKAWIAAGSPSEFTITVLEQGKRNFFGFSKEPAIVSISYQAPAHVPKNARPSHNKQGRTPSAPLPKNHAADKKQQASVKARINEKAGQQVQKFETNAWEPEHVQTVKQWLSELIGQMDITSTFATQLDNATLMITFHSPLHNDAQEERMLCQALGHLLLQFLKRRYKKKFAGLHLTIHTQHGNSEKGA